VGLGLIALSIPAALFTLAPNAQAIGFVLGSTAITTLPTTAGAIGNLTNQSGLSTPYTSGVTDFDTYAATSATNLNSQRWLTSVAGLGGYVTFDLGASYDLNAFALWNTLGSPAVLNFTLFTDTDTSTATVGTLIGSFSAVNGLASGSPLQRFDFASTATTQYVQMRLDTSNGGGVVGFSEAAFGGTTPTAVPFDFDPSLGLVALELGFGGKRLLKTFLRNNKSKKE
jgi:hypothetical protein